MTDHTIMELQCDITNPRPDRRSKDWDKLPVIPAKSRFIVSISGDYATLRLSTDRYASWMPLRSELGRVIEAHSQQVEPKTVRELAVVYNCDWGCDEIMRILLKLGRIRRDDFIAVAQVPEGY